MEVDKSVTIYTVNMDILILELIFLKEKIL